MRVAKINKVISLSIVCACIAKFLLADLNLINFIRIATVSKFT